MRAVGKEAFFFPRSAFDELYASCSACSLPAVLRTRTATSLDGDLRMSTAVSADVTRDFKFESLADLRLLASFLECPTLNVYPRGYKPSVSQKLSFIYGDVNVVHPAVKGTFIKLTYNYTLSTLRVVVSGSRINNLTAAGAEAYLPSSTAPPPPPSPQPASVTVTDDLLLGYTLDIDQGTYEVSNSPFWSLLLIEGSGDTPLVMSRASIARRVLADLNG